MEKTVLSVQQYLSKAARYCALAEHSEAQVRQKLYQWGCEPADMDTIIDYLFDNNYLNEERFCQAFVHDQVFYQAWGRQKIRAALQAQHIPYAIVDKALENIDEIEYNRQLCHLIEKKKGTDRDRLMRFLLQRGFTYEEINNQLG